LPVRDHDYPSRQWAMSERHTQVGSDTGGFTGGNRY
jgi:hypothetical protein